MRGAAAGSSSSSSSRESESKVNMMKQIRSHEVALAELNALSSSRVSSLPLFLFHYSFFSILYFSYIAHSTYSFFSSY